MRALSHPRLGRACCPQRDQLSFAYVVRIQRPAARVYVIPRRFHWSVAVESDTMTCYNATLHDAQQLARRFQHGRSPPRAMPRRQVHMAARAISKTAIGIARDVEVQQTSLH